MIMNAIKILSLIGVFAMLTSCNSYYLGKFNKTGNKLNSSNLTDLNGNYSCAPIAAYSYGKEINLPLTYNHLLHHSLLNIPEQSNQPKNALDSLEPDKKLYVNIRVDTITNKITVTDYENDKIKDQFIIPFTVRKNHIYLKNKYKKKWGVPYLFGGEAKSKCRVGLTKDGNLKAQIQSENGGAILFILAAGNQSDRTYVFERLPTL